MSDGRTIWWPKDAAWWRRGRVVALCREFGPTGPAVLDLLSCEAKAQNDGGFVKAAEGTVARDLFIEPEVVRNILARARELGALDDFREGEADLFVCRISGWEQDNERVLAADRQRRYRERQAAKTGPDAGEVTEGDAALSAVPKVTKRGQDSTEQDKTEEQLSEKRSGRGRGKADHDALPDDFPSTLEQYVAPVLAVLSRIAELRQGAIPPTRLAVARALVSYSDRDFVLAAEEYEHWLTHGTGQRRLPKDPVSGYRNQLKMREPVARKTMAPSPRPVALKPPPPETWPIIDSELRKEIGDFSHHQWIEPLKPIGVDGDRIYVEAQEYVRSWVTERYGEALTKAAGAAGLEAIEIVAVGEAVAA